MTLPRVSICGWCGRALGLESDRRLPPGEHVGKIRVTSVPCERCKRSIGPDGVDGGGPMKGSDGNIVTYPDTEKPYREEKKDGPQ